MDRSKPWLSSLPWGWRTLHPSWGAGKPRQHSALKEHYEIYMWPLWCPEFPALSLSEHSPFFLRIRNRGLGRNVPTWLSWSNSGGGGGKSSTAGGTEITEIDANVCFGGNREGRYLRIERWHVVCETVAFEQQSSGLAVVEQRCHGDWIVPAVTWHHLVAQCLHTDWVHHPEQW